MTSPTDAFVYLTENYPEDDRDDLSRSRLMGMLYLADWRSALLRRTPMTNAKWVLGRFGAYAEDAFSLLENPTPPFRVVEEENPYGTPKVRVELTSDDVPTPTVDADAREILDYVIETTKPLRWSEFVGLVNSTYPMVAARERFAELDLSQLVDQYEASQQLIEGDPAERPGSVA
jgi:hypothetical protein